MKISEQDRAELASVAKGIDVPLTALLAVVEVASNGEIGGELLGRTASV